MCVARYINLLISNSHHPDVSPSQQKRYLDIAIRSADHLMLQGVIDPLDGGIYTGIQQSTSALPIFSKKLKTQAYSMEALYALYQETKYPRYLHTADNIFHYVEKKLTLPDGGYALGIIDAENNATDNPCTWTLEELESTLTPEETKLCTLAFDIQGLGNIPLVDDRSRNYFRQNTLTWKHTLEELASTTGTDPSTLQKKLESITKKLAKCRTEKPAKPIIEKLSTANTIALLAQAHITAYRATGDNKYLNRAIQTLTFIREHFIDAQGQLHHARYKGKLLDFPAYGVDYTQICQTALNLHEVTLDADWLQFATETHQKMIKQLGNSINHEIKESSGADYPYPFNVYQYLNIKALDNQSTWALAYSNATRLSTRQNSQQLQSQSKELLGAMLATLNYSPLLNIDFLTNEAKLRQPTVYFKLPTSPELLKAAVTTPCQIIAIPEKLQTNKQFPGLANNPSTIPPKNAIIIKNGKTLGQVSQATELLKLLNPQK
jgi:uncharacterized protein YyaL (SSP411 family)